MDDNNKQTIEPTAAVRNDAQRRGAGVMAGVSVLVAVAAWVAFCFSPGAGALLGVVATVLAVLGLRCGRGCLRDIAVTSLIAAVVLVVVYSLFAWGLPWLIKSL